MQLELAVKSDTEVEAGYVCSCGCRPQLSYRRDAESQKHVCCCGTQLVVGRDAADGLEIEAGAHAEVQRFESPWGETLEAAWVLGSGMHGHGHGHGEHGHSHSEHDA